MGAGPRAWLAEGIGTFALVAVGTGAIVVDDLTGGALSHLGVALAFGVVVGAMIYAVGDVSGAHLNPAVTIAAWLSRRVTSRDVAPFIAAQLAGALIASVGLRALFAEHETLGATLPSAGALPSFAIEVVISFLLVFVILTVTRRTAETAAFSGVAIGATVFLCALVAGPLCGASMNPARSLAPAVVSGHLAGLWIYLLAPIGGAVLAVAGCRAVRDPGCCT